MGIACKIPRLACAVENVIGVPCRQGSAMALWFERLMANLRHIEFWPSPAACSVAAIGFLVLLSFVGCGPRSDRLAISGKVTLNGAPLDLGSIRFSSIKSEKLYASGAMVKD